jgi:AcrR family transcriptional regulator
VGVAPDPPFRAVQQELLDAAERLVGELSFSFSPVPLSDVCKRASVSPSAAYAIWESQEDFDRDLMRFLLDANRMRAPEETFDAALTLLEDDGPSLQEFIRRVTPINLSFIEQGRTFHNFVAVVPAGDDPEAREVLRGYVESYRPLINRLIRLGLVFYRRRLRAGMCLDTLFMLVQGFVQGVAVRERLEPDTIRTDVARDDGTTWHIVALGVEALLSGSTEEVR